MGRFIHGAAAAAALVLGLTQPVFGGSSKTSSIAVTSTVGSNCVIQNATLQFVNYDPDVNNRTAPLDVTGSLQYDCTKNVAPLIGLDHGLNGSHASGTTRAMSTGGGSPSYLSYEVYKDAARTLVWSNTSPDAPGATRSGRTQQTVTMYGRVPPGQKVPISSAYADVLTATINF
jgi:spore coat protein U-like protein